MFFWDTLYIFWYQHWILIWMTVNLNFAIEICIAMIVVAKYLHFKHKRTCHFIHFSKDFNIFSKCPSQLMIFFSEFVRFVLLELFHLVLKYPTFIFLLVSVISEFTRIFLIFLPTTVCPKVKWLFASICIIGSDHSPNQICFWIKAGYSDEAMDLCLKNASNTQSAQQNGLA